jgi:hypothetical protein
MFRATRPIITTQPSTVHVQSLLIRLDGITAGDYLTWVRDPEPAALNHELRSVAISAEPLGDLVNTELVWSGRPPRTPCAGAVAAGFALTPEVVEVIGATRVVGAGQPSSHARMLARSHSPSPSERPV